MGRAARAFAEANRVDEPFTAVLDSEAYRRQLRKKKKQDEQQFVPESVGELELWQPRIGTGAPLHPLAANEVPGPEDSSLALGASAD